jgi:hypothetical protein
MLPSRIVGQARAHTSPSTTADRNARLAARFKPLLEHHPNFVFIVAKVNDEFAGAAGWELQYAASRCTVV